MNVRTLEKPYSIDRQAIVIILLLIFYAVGIIALFFGLSPEIIQFTPMQLVGSLALVLWCHEPWNTKTVSVLAFVYMAGLGVEVAGVQTGLIFGEYNYGPVFGPQIAGTPFLIGVNWVMLIYCSAITVNKIIPEASTLIKALLGAFIMTSLDFLIEPVAMRFYFWDWAGGVIPLQNYVMWFVISLALHFVFHVALQPKFNKAAVALLCLQFLFFGILNL